PESMADAKLAAMPPVTGLYAFLAGALGVLLFSTSRQLSVGPDSTIGPMMAVGVGSLVVTTSSPDYSTRIVLLGLLLGVALLAAGAARLGWLADLLSRPVMSGFLSGVGVTVVVGQLHVLLGLPASAGGTVQKFASVAQHLGGVNVATLAVGAAVLAVVLGGERLGPRFPGALLAVIGSLVAVAALGLGDRGVALVGRLPPGLPSLSLVQPAPADVMALVPVAVPIFFVILAQTAATSRGFAVSGGYDVVVDRDFLAVGTASVLSSLAGAFAVNASPTRTGVVAASNGRSQIVNLVAGLLVAAVLLVATGVLADLPEATLGGILVAVGVKLVKWRDLVSVARYSRPEAAIAVVTLLVVAVVGIQEGIYLAIVLALLRRTYLSARPHDAVLGRLPGPEGVWVSRRSRPEAEAPAGVPVFRFDAPLFYANAQHFAARARAVVAEAGQPVRALVIEAVGIDDVDFTGTQVLTELDEELRARGVTLAIAHPFGRLGTELTAGSLVQRFQGRVFNSVDDAVAAMRTVQ
ncbi:MAG TPA: SulP family inorganic anion transporter, partial [Acidimicrobiales bacterium]|nr:SulP family inorganic anion transporter [Acidimicrobiales bacterium]